MNSKNKQEYIYLIRINDVFKIGRTSNLKNRLSQLKTGNPEVSEYYEYFAILPKYKANFLEKTLHALFRISKIQGEWFELTINDLLQIDSFMSDKCIYKVLVDRLNHTNYNSIMN